MSRARTATAILDARGAFQKNPDRNRQDPKVSKPFPMRAPSCLTPLQVKSWHWLVKQVPDGVLTGADQATLHLAACLWAEFQARPDEMPTARIAQMRGVMGTLGLSPSDRAKLAVKPEKDNDGF